MGYENSKEGEFLRQKDHDKQVRSMVRSKNIDMLANNGYNLTNGEVRKTVEVPIHGTYNPPGSSGSVMGRAGEQVFGGGFAGRPIRGLEKAFGKRVGNQLEEAQYAPVSLNQGMQVQSQPLLPIHQKGPPALQPANKEYFGNAYQPHQI